ncbi:hypothetical protein AWJ20_4144 [Sugiyamaella lignohabitans]|uniref:AB hydrolase-1 domain-containing protein n=1 Tax=Sugiyamaella lignohabitans TaxID=796027 RepID=A0A167C815_9ASCO|nr:uncharacterized protein AWJ20_4144 [Sugiyamaella lignohabitans]ANB11339.1 hypothetical protein AWJ20_4144 [Sugiyamaella lignohabitans]
MTTQFVTASDGIKLNVTTWGNADKVPVVLVHGYPDSHMVWLPLIAELEDNYYVIAYDVRGHGKSEVPKAVKDYKLDQLARDLKAVVDTLIPDQKFHLVGHDWGSVQSWHSVTTDPLKGRIASYTSISGPSLDHTSFWIKDSIRSLSWARIRNVFLQWKASWYILVFQIPYVAEWFWKRLMYPNFQKHLEKNEGVALSASPTRFQDGLNGLSLYRANILSRRPRPTRELYAHCPVQVVVLTKDRYITQPMLETLPKWVNHLYRRELDEKHWAILVQPKVVAGYIDEFVAAVDSNRLDTLNSLKWN